MLLEDAMRMDIGSRRRTGVTLRESHYLPDQRSGGGGGYHDGTMVHVSGNVAIAAAGCEMTENAEAKIEGGVE